MLVIILVSHQVLILATLLAIPYRPHLVFYHCLSSFLLEVGLMLLSVTLSLNLANPALLSLERTLAVPCQLMLIPQPILGKWPIFIDNQIKIFIGFGWTKYWRMTFNLSILPKFCPTKILHCTVCILDCQHIKPCVTSLATLMYNLCKIQCS